jgi:hypothetical protein
MEKRTLGRTGIKVSLFGMGGLFISSILRSLSDYHLDDNILVPQQLDKAIVKK